MTITQILEYLMKQQYRYHLPILSMTNGMALPTKKNILPCGQSYKRYIIVNYDSRVEL